MSLLKFGFSRAKRQENEDIATNDAEATKRRRCDSHCVESDTGMYIVFFVDSPISFIQFSSFLYFPNK